MHVDPESSKSAGILRADNAGAYDRQRFREHADLENLIRVVHAGMLEWKFRRTYGRGTGRDENSLAAQQRVRSDTHRVGINKTRRTMKRRDVVDSHLLFSASAFVNRDGRFVAHEIPNGGLSPEREIHAKELARTYAGEGQRCFAQGLARDRASVNTGAADFTEFFDERDAFAKDPRGSRSANAGRPAADHYHIEVFSHRLAPSRRVTTELIAVRLWA